MAATAPVDSQVKTNAILAWIFAPFTSFAWKDSTDEFVKAHARASLYLGIANVASTILLIVFQICFGILFGALFYSGPTAIIGSLLSCGLGIVGLANWAFVVVPRIIGVIKANNGEKWEMPYVTQMVSKFVKL